jgi:RNA polymerase sigma-54 factor
MKQSLQLKIGQHLTMTPQLQQAIRLLQLSSLELQQEIQEVLDSNIMLEMNEVEENGGSTESESNADTLNEISASESESSGEIKDQVESENIPDELPVDTNWDDIYEVNTGGTGGVGTDTSDYEYQGKTTESLYDHLLWQLELTHFSEDDRLIAEAILDAIDADGYLSTSLDELRESLQEDLPEVENEEILAVLHQIQNFDPVGIAARDLGECLLIQLRHMPMDTDCREMAEQLVRDHFDLMAKRDFNQIKRRMKINDEELKEIFQLVHSLNPRPGNQIATDDTEYVVPDVFVMKKNGQWRVELNAETAPRLRINPYYAGLIKRGDNSADNVSMKNHMQEAKWFLKSLQSRNETLLKVATSIVERQRDFFEHGEEAMKPMVLHDIADAIGMHESTISRVTNKKYLQCPRGIYELKFFFSSHVKSDAGDDHSSTAIHAHIKKLIAEENPAKPLSDSKITELLAEQGINVARRTIAKYREAMNIPSSSQRKRLA